MEIACLDLEGVLVPEVWINVARHTGIEALKVTTRDEPDYDKLMRRRLGILEQHGLRLRDIQEVIGKMGPLEGAYDFLQWLKESCQVVILSDTFYEFADPLMKQLGRPVLLCHGLVVDEQNRVVDYRLRLRDQKKLAVKAFQELKFRVIAVGDSYNDTSMLLQADAGLLFRPPANVVDEFPQFPVSHEYDQLRQAFVECSERLAFRGGNA